MTVALERYPCLTAEEFYDGYAHLDGEFELVGGKVIQMTPPGPFNGRFDRRILRALDNYVTAHGLGEVFPNSGFILQRNPDIVRAPDQAFVSAARMAASPPPVVGYWEIVPDLAVEVVSPGDTAAEVQEKVAGYLEAGVPLVWVLYPQRQAVYVYRSNRDVQVIAVDGELSGEDVIPGFGILTRLIWEGPDSEIAASGM